MRQNNRRHKKLFFPLGIITLAILPVFGFQKIAEIYYQKIALPNCIELNIADSDTIFFGNKVGKKYSEVRKYTTYKLATNALQNSIILNHAREKLNKIKNNKDTLNGVHIVFNDSTKYQDYIKAVDYSFEKSPAMFFCYQNNLWAMYDYVDTTGWHKNKFENELDM